MKIQKKLWLVLIIASFQWVSHAQITYQKTLVTHISAVEVQALLVDLKGLVEIHTWDQDLVRISMDVTTNIPQTNVIDFLVTIDRYQVTGELKPDHTLRIQTPNINKIVWVNQKQLEDDIRYRIFVPKDRMIFCESELLAEY